MSVSENPEGLPDLERDIEVILERVERPRIERPGWDEATRPGATAEAAWNFAAQAMTDAEALAAAYREQQRHHEEHHEQPTRCEYDTDQYAHGGLSICVSCRVRLERRIEQAEERLKVASAEILKALSELSPPTLFSQLDWISQNLAAPEGTQEEPNA